MPKCGVLGWFSGFTRLLELAFATEDAAACGGAQAKTRGHVRHFSAGASNRKANASISPFCYTVNEHFHYFYLVGYLMNHRLFAPPDASPLSASDTTSWMPAASCSSSRAVISSLQSHHFSSLSSKAFALISLMASVSGWMFFHRKLVIRISCHSAVVRTKKSRRDSKGCAVVRKRRDSNVCGVSLTLG